MRKLIIVVIIISAIILCGVGLEQLLDFGKDLFTVVSYQQQVSQEEFTSVKFRAVNENTVLLDAVLALNDSFLTNSPIENKIDKKLNKSYEILNFFPTLQSYHTGKRKIEKAIFTELPKLHRQISDLSESELQTFFSNNKVYLDKNFGITDVDALNLLAFSLSGFENENIVDCYIVSDSIIYNSYDNSSLFNVVIVTEDNEKCLLGVNARLESSTPNQNSPEIQINGSFGGVE